MGAALLRITARCSRSRPLWAISGHGSQFAQCPLYSQKQTSPSVTEGTTLQAAAEALDQPIAIVNVSAERDIEGAFAAIVQRKVGALIVSSDPLFFLARKMLVVSMVRYALPTIFADREQVEAGGLVSYGASRPDAYRQAGNYVGRVVKGENPGDLPIVLPTKIPLLINLKTAKALGLEIPPSLLARADEVIE